MAVDTDSATEPSRGLCSRISTVAFPAGSGGSGRLNDPHSSLVPSDAVAKSSTTITPRASVTRYSSPSFERAHEAAQGVSSADRGAECRA